MYLIYQARISILTLFTFATVFACLPISAQIPPPAPGTVQPTGLVSEPATAPGPNNYQPGVDQGLNSQDATLRLRLEKGMTIVFPIQDGLDTRWKRVGDYAFQAHIDYADARGYAFDWQMSPPASASGSRAVEMEDVKEAHKVSLFYPDSESATLVGYTSIVRISDYLYGKLKAGEKSSFELDGPDSPQVYKRPTMPVATAIAPVGIDEVDVIINGRPFKVRAIKAQTDVGWNYWILDNPRFPIMLQGDGPFGWSGIQITYRSNKNNTGGSTNNDTSKQADREARKVIDQLEKSGQATSYMILFDFDSANLKLVSKEILSRLADYMKNKPDLRLRIEGHTCTIGKQQYNQDLSERRALSVKTYLFEVCGIDSTRLAARGYGFSKPIASNKTESGRRKNRRVVFSEIKN